MPDPTTALTDACCAPIDVVGADVQAMHESLAGKGLLAADGSRPGG